MSRRAAITGLVLSSLTLLLTLFAIAASDLSLPGPSVGSWLGVADPEPAEPCKFDPDKVVDPPGSPAPGSWRREPNSPTSAPELGAAAVGRYIYLVGGQTPLAAEKSIFRFDPQSDSYRRVAELPVALDHPAVAAHGDELIVAGGYIDGAHSTNRVWSFTPHTGVVEELPSMRFPRGAAAAAVLGDRLYVAGGVPEFGNQYQPRDSLEIFHFDDRTWTAGADMPTARHHFGAATLNGKIYFAGGRQPADRSLSAFEAYTPATNRWRRLPSLAIGVGSAGVTGAVGKVFVVGGGDDGLHFHGGRYVVRAVYAYDPRDRRWTRLPDMGRPRQGGAVAVAGNRLYAFRGIPCPDYGRMAATESLPLH